MEGSGPATSLGEAIRRQRELSKVSMRQFASMAGISNPYLSQIERGLREPSERVLDAIARSLETSTDALVRAGRHGAPSRPRTESSGRARRSRTTTRLTGRQRRALLVIYDAFVAANRR